MDGWKPGVVRVATDRGVLDYQGMTKGGLGMIIAKKAGPFEMPPATIALMHLGSGHVLLWIKATFDRAARLIAEIERLGDWDFDGLNGWQNRDPTLSLKLQAVVERNLDVISFPEHGPDDVQARKIARERAE